MQFHKHHIVPKWRCKELGIDPEFEDNYAYPIREQHALIHWGYKCGDLSPLLEICNPPQYVIDMIPLGDNRDVGAALIIAKGEIDEIDQSGENNPNWKGGISYDKKEYNKHWWQTPQNKEKNRLYQREFRQKPEYAEYRKKYREKNKEKIREQNRQYQNTPEYAEYRRKYREKNKEKIREYEKDYKRKYRLRKKLERQGQGTLEPFIG